MKIEQHDSHEKLAKAAADRVIALVRQNPRAVIGLATGDTPKPFYRELIRQYQESLRTDSPLDFSHITFFTLDEYVGLLEDHPQSYHTYLHENLFNHINANPQNIHIPNGNAKDLDQECRDYEAAIKQAGGVDIWIAGIGANGHVAFNEPGSRIFDHTRVVTLSKKTREDNSRFFDNDPNKVPAQAISVGLATLKEHAKEVFLMASGTNKAAALATVLEGSYRVNSPASVLTTMKGLTVFADEAALSAHHAKHAGRSSA